MKNDSRKTLKQRIAQMEKDASKVMKEIDGCDGMWFHFEGCTVEELREEGEKRGQKMTYNETQGKMVVQFSCVWEGVTLFCYSGKIKVETHFVEDYAVKNI